MELCRHIFFILSTAAIMIFVNGTSKSDEDILNASTLDEIEKSINQVICRLLEEERDRLSRLDTAILLKVREYLQSEAPKEDYMPAELPSFERPSPEAIEESIARNLKEILYQYSTTMTNEDLKFLLLSTNLDENTFQSTTNGTSLENTKAGEKDNIFEKKSFKSLFEQENLPPANAGSSSQILRSNRLHGQDDRSTEKIPRPNDEKMDNIFETKSFKSLFEATDDSSTNKIDSTHQTLSSEASTADKGKQVQQTRVDNSNPPDDFTLLIVPKTRGTRVFTDLLDNDIHPRNFDVKKKKEYPSGAVLFTFNSAKGKEGLKKLVEKSSRYIIEAQKKTFPHSVRVPKVPLQVAEDEIWEAIEDKFDESPMVVNLIRFGHAGYRKYMDVVLRVSDALFEAIKKSPKLQIRNHEYDIDCSESVVRCFKCHLLGHTSKFCDHEPRPFPTADENCIDCSYYNEQICGLKISDIRKPRDVNHPTGDSKCETKQYYDDLWQKQRRGE